MKRVLQAAVMTVIWLLLWSSTHWASALVGAIIALILLGVRDRLRAERTSKSLRLRPVATMRLVLAFLWAVVRSALGVAREALRFRITVRPAFIRLPLNDHTDAGITTLASLISLTPGTLSLEVGIDRQVLYIHALDVDGGIDGVRERVAEDLQRPLERALPPTTEAPSTAKAPAR